MNKNFKKMFLSGMLATLFIVSTLIGQKYTNFMGLVVSVNFIVYPFMMLCSLLLLNSFGKKETYNAMFSSILIQAVILLVYILGTSLGSQSMLADLSEEINKVFDISGLQLVASFIGFMFSNYVLIYVYDYFNSIKYRLVGTIVSSVLSMILYGVITICIIHFELSFETLLNLLLCYVIVSIIMCILVTILFYILHEKETGGYHISEYQEENLKETKKYNNDKPISEIIDLHNKEDQSRRKNNKKRNYTKKNEKNNNKYEKNRTKSGKISKK